MHLPGVVAARPHGAELLGHPLHERSAEERPPRRVDDDAAEAAARGGLRIAQVEVPQHALPLRAAAGRRAVVRAHVDLEALGDAATRLGLVLVALDRREVVADGREVLAVGAVERPLQLLGARGRARGGRHHGHQQVGRKLGDRQDAARRAQDRLLGVDGAPVHVAEHRAAEERVVDPLDAAAEHHEDIEGVAQRPDRVAEPVLDLGAVRGGAAPAVDGVRHQADASAGLDLLGNLVEAAADDHGREQRPVVGQVLRPCGGVVARHEHRRQPVRDDEAPVDALVVRDAVGVLLGDRDVSRSGAQAERARGAPLQGAGGLAPGGAVA